MYSDRIARAFHRTSISRRFAALCMTLLAVLVVAPPAYASANLTVKSISWNVIGLDSNNVNDGPNTFPVGTRVCNTGDATASNVTASFVWDSSNAYLSLGDPATHSVGTLQANKCADVYFTAVVARNSSAYNTVRGFHVSVTATGLGTVSTSTPRELYIEKLVSQNRNALINFTGPTSVRVGATVTYTVTTKTATGGYEQLVSESLFPTSIFEVVSTAVTYTSPSGATNDQLYADACGWDPVPTNGTYRSCVGPANFSGGKAGGNPITTTYTLKVVGAGTASVNALIYDFSGSSYHYNSDFGTPVASITSAANTDPVANNDNASTSPGTAVQVNVLNNDTDADGDTLTVSGSSNPGHGSVTCTTTRCTYTPSNGYSGSDSFTYTISDGYGGSSTATVNVTVSTPVPAFGIDSPIPVAVLIVALGVGMSLRRRNAWNGQR